ncbi:ABC transporter permease, partial [Listeria monocytogenes]|nr:ABC transporter permease [Listeria monocytogenes]
MNKLKIIIKDTYLRNIKSMSFLSMVFSPLLVIVAILAITYFISKPSVDPNIALISNDTELVSYLSQDSSGYTVNESINTVEKANSSLSSGDIVGYFVLNNENNYVTGEYTATTANDTLIG